MRDLSSRKAIAVISLNNRFTNHRSGGGGQLLLFRGALTALQSKEATMQNSKIKSRIKSLVLGIFISAWDRDECMRTNPITGSRFVPGVDSFRKQLEAACRLVEVSLGFADLNIVGLPRFPWDMLERETLKGTNLLNHIVALYARSLAYRDYDLCGHPSFSDYASGVLAEPWLAELFGDRYPGQDVPFEPKVLPGIDASGYFRPKGRNVRSLSVGI